MSKSHVPSARGIKNRLSSIRSPFKRPPPLNEDDLISHLSPSITVQFSPGLRSPYIVISPSLSAHSSKASERSAALCPSPKVWAEQLASPRPATGKREKFEDLKRSKLPADVPTATFDNSVGSMFASTDSSASDSDDSTTEINSKFKRRSIRFAKIPNSPIPRARSQQEIEKALSFLPYPLSPYPRSPKPRTNNNSNNNKPGFRRNSNIKHSRLADDEAPVLKQSTAPLRPKLIIPSKSPGLSNFTNVPGIPRVLPPGLRRKDFLSPVAEVPTSPFLVSECSSGDEASDATTSTLNTAFWRSMTVQRHLSSSDESDSSTDSVPGSHSPYPIFLYGKSDVSLARKEPLPSPSADASSQFPFTPKRTASAARSFEMMLSPTPNDSIASFSSLAAALEYLGAEGMMFSREELFF
jgi:hypothetical protein